jgi:hypothetical protein
VDEEAGVGEELVDAGGGGGVLDGVAQQVGRGEIPPAPIPVVHRDRGQQPVQELRGVGVGGAVWGGAQLVGQALVEQPVQGGSVGVGAGAQVEPQLFELVRDLSFNRGRHGPAGHGGGQHGAGDTGAAGVRQGGQQEAPP